MRHSKSAHEVKPFPSVRRMVTDVGWMARRRNTVRGLLEIDVTTPRQVMRAHEEATGERLSFTSYLAFCVGQAVDANKHLHAYRDWRGGLVLFDEVDITTMIEVKEGDKEFPVGHVVRAANKKTFRQIHDEIRAVQMRATASEEVRRLRLLAVLPAFVRRPALLLMSRQPQLIKKVQGTVVLSARRPHRRAGILECDHRFRPRHRGRRAGLPLRPAIPRPGRERARPGIRLTER